jgi:hypothetical protein
VNLCLICRLFYGSNDHYDNQQPGYGLQFKVIDNSITYLLLRTGPELLGSSLESQLSLNFHDLLLILFEMLIIFFLEFLQQSSNI